MERNSNLDKSFQIFVVDINIIYIYIYITLLTLDVINFSKNSYNA
jgi:hypothetical protein